VLTDLVRSYTAQAQSVVPQFLAMSFDMLRQGPGKFAEQITAINPMMAQMSKMPGFDAMQRQQQAFMETMMAGWPRTGAQPREGAEGEAQSPSETEDLDEIRANCASCKKSSRSWAAGPQTFSNRCSRSHGLMTCWNSLYSWRLTEA
jgi:polyhydroxyalkanoate synthesis regulator protein